MFPFENIRNLNQIFFDFELYNIDKTVKWTKTFQKLENNNKVDDLIFHSE